MARNDHCNHWSNALVRDAPACLIACATDGAIVQVSKSFSALTGYELSDLPTLTDWFMTVPGADRAQAAAMAAEMAAAPVAGAVTPRREITVMTRDESPRHCVVQRLGPVPGPGGAAWLLSTVIDVTDHRNTEIALQEKQRFVDKIFETHPDILYVYNIKQGAPVFQNRLMGEDIGYSKSEIEAMGDNLVARLLHPDDMAGFGEHMQRVAGAQDGEILRFEHRMRHRDGSFRHHAARDTVFSRNAAGEVVEILGTAHDITESNRLQEEQLEMSLHVQELQKMESLAMLAGGIAHDFNNLLVGIMGSADLAMNEVPASSPAVEDLKRIQNTAVECAELCKQLLAYAGKGKFIVEPFRLSEMIKQIGHLLQISISKKVALRYDFAEHVPPVEGDIRQIRQVIMNLIKNASDAIEDKSGVITIAVGLVEANRAYLDDVAVGANLREGYYVTLEVSDTGCGISREMLPRIFDPFFSNKREGRGLGLAAVRGIIANHGGALRVYSEEGKGSSFKVLLPASENPVAPQPSLDASQDAALGGGTVLVVDDEETVRVVTSRALKMLGFSVLVATDGREAVAIYREYQSEIRAVLLDMMMPRMGGVATFRELRQLNASVRVVLMSGYNEQEATNAFTGKGLAGFVQKPFRQADLIAALEGALKLPAR